MVVRGHVQARHAGQDRRQQRLLERGGEPPQTLTFALGLLARAQEFFLVGAAVAGVEDGGADQQRLPVAAGLDLGGHQHRQPAAVGRLHLQRDAADLSLHTQQWGEVRFVVQPSPDGEEVGERPAAHQVAALVSQPVQQSGVDLGDLSVEQGGEVSTRGMLVEVLGAVFQ